MNKKYICAIFLCLAVLSIGPASAIYGAKVPSGGATSPAVGAPLSAFSPIGIGPQSAFRVAYWDIGTTAGLYDAADVAYLQFGGPAVGPGKIVKENDIRLTPWAGGPGYAAGSAVAAGDLDIGMHLMPFPPLPAGVTAGFFYLEVDGAPGYSLGDPVYVKTQSTTPMLNGLGTNDIRITGWGPFAAGSLVVITNPDAGKALTPFKAFGAPALGIGTTAPAVPIGQLAFYNANGNVNGAGLPIYDGGDLVYFDVAPLGVVSPNDIELFL
jgi:hypothetical protein